MIGTLKITNEVFKELHDINYKMLSGADLNETLNLIVQNAKRFFGADSCNLQLYDKRTGLYSRPAKAGLSVEWIHSPRVDGIGAKALKKGGRFWEPSPRNLRKEVRSAGINCGGAFPLQPEGKPTVGILYLHFVNNPKFTEEHFRVIELFSYQAGLAITLAMLRKSDQERIEDLELLRSAILKTLEPVVLCEALEMIARMAKTVMKADCAILLPKNPQKGVINRALVVEYGIEELDRLKFSAPRPNGLTSEVMKCGEYSCKNVDVK
jgi:hypothetical protein